MLFGALALLATAAPSAQNESGEALPSMEFFEYLGALAEAEGEWIGPEDMAVSLFDDDATSGQTDLEPTGEREAAQSAPPPAGAQPASVETAR